MAATRDGNGYWFVAQDGGIFNYGRASFYGSTGNVPLSQRIVSITATPGQRPLVRRHRVLRVGRRPSVELAERQHGLITRPGCVPILIGPVW
jgi:hypothetical protein